MCHLAHDDLGRALETARKGVTAAARTDDLTTQAMARQSLIFALGALGAEPEIRAEIPELINVAETLGNPTLRAASYSICAAALDLVGHTGEALAMFRRAVADADHAGPAIAADARFWCAYEIDDQHEAAELLRQAIPIARDHLAGGPQLHALVPTAKYALGTGNAVQAARLIGAYQHWAGRYGGFTALLLEGRWCQRLREQLAATLAPDMLNEEVARGAQLRPDQALDLAYDIITRNEPDSTVTDRASPT
jgi:hypothetical protein